MGVFTKRVSMAGRYRMPFLLIGGAFALSAATVSFIGFSSANPIGAVAQAEDAAGEAGAADTPKKARQPDPKPKPKPVKPAAEKAKPEAAKAAAPTTPQAPATLVGAAGAGANTAPLNISGKLAQNGAGTCGSAIDAEAVPSMVGVTQSNTVSLWSNVEPRDKHAASVFIGQRYGANQAVPYGVTGLIAAPTPSGSCDVTVVQVVASPLPCANVRESMTRQQGKLMGNVAGLPLIQSADNQTLLMPTSTNSCVLIGFRSKFGN